MISFPPEAVLVPTDLSATSMAALRHARWLHERFGSRVTVLHAERLEVPPYFTQAQEAELLETARGARREAVAEVGRAAEAVLGFRPETLVVEGYAATVILDVVREGAYGLVILGTHGRRGPSRLWLGSVAERVLRATTVPALAVRDGISPAGFHRVFCPVTSSEASARALDYAVSLSEALGAELHVLRATDGDDAAVAECPEVTAAMRSRCSVVEKTVHGNPVPAFLSAAREARADLVVLGGEHPESFLAEIFSSTTDQILRRMATPLLVVPDRPSA